VRVPEPLMTPDRFRKQFVATLMKVPLGRSTGPDQELDP